MSDYTKTTNFTAKDALSSGDPNKIIYGATLDTEFDNIATAVATKLNEDLTGLTGTVPVANGGTGQTSYTNGQLLIGNTTGNTLTKATLTAGTNISITNGTGSITVATTGLGALATANSVNQGTIDALAVGQGELKSTTGSQSTLQNAGASFDVTLTGGTYSWWTAGGDGAAGGFGFGSGNTVAGIVGFYNNNTAAATIYIDERYVQASPPYTKEFYAYVGLDGSGNILHVSVAPDPIWAYNGPTSIRTEYRRDGKAYRRERRINGVPYKTAIRNPAILRRYLSGELACDLTEVELTPEYKDSDMEIVPHPFLGNNLSGVTVVLLHGPMLSRFVDMCNAEDAAEVRDIVSRYLTIDNTTNGATGQPSVVMPVNCRWKLT